MSFQDLPADIRHRPIDTPALAADLVDLFTFEASRAQGCLLIVILDRRGLALDPILVNEVDEGREPEGARAFFEGLCGELRPPALVLARGRPGGRQLRDTDRAWHQLFLDVCRSHEVPLVGAFLAIPGEVHPLPLDLRLVS